MDSAPGRGRNRKRCRVEIHGVDVQLVEVEQQKADHFMPADLRIRCGRDEREGANVVAPDTAVGQDTRSGEPDPLVPVDRRLTADQR